ncbi:MAG TPA: NAD(P)H-binding protein [Dehalococcoidia bacterium]|nr:NAD(P)H-binding protein [Dehalococcoidia bacterium]
MVASIGEGRSAMILVSGGTGFVGSAIVAELVRRGEKVAVLGRDAAKIRARFGADLQARAGDVREPAALAAAMRDVDVVVNAVQFPNSPIENRRKGWTFEEIDLKGTRHQVDAAKAAGARRFVYVSGVGAARDAGRHWFRYKWEAEDYLQRSGLEWAIVRPTWVYGPGDVSLNRFLGFAKLLPFIPMFGNGKQPMQPVFIDDVGRVCADAATRPEAADQLFELGGPDVMSMNEVVATALEVAGKRRALLHQPAAIGKLLGTLASALPSPPLTADAIDFITEAAVADNTLAVQVLHARLTPLREGLASYLGKRA